MVTYTLTLSVAQMGLIRETVAGFEDNQKMIHVPTITGERVAVALPVGVLDELIARLGDVDGAVEIDYRTEPLDEEGHVHVTLTWDKPVEGRLAYEINEGDFSLE